MSLLDITLSSGREIQLMQFFQRRAYDSLLLGSPDERVNEFVRQAFVHKAAELFPWSPTFLVEPRLVSTQDEIRLPSIACIGNFESIAVVQGHLQSTALSIIWFEDLAEPRLTAANLEKIRHLYWEEYARDLDLL